MLVCLDPGHGGNDPGAGGFGLVEKDITLEVSLKAAEILKTNGINVVLSRTADITLEPEPRIKAVNSYNADVVVSVHYNSFNGSARGFEVIHSGFKEDNSKQLAQFIFDHLKTLDLPSRKVYSRENSTGDQDYYFMIRRIAATSVIVESAFIDNSEDNALLKSASFRAANAEAIARGILDFKNRYFPPKDDMNIENTSEWARESIVRMKELGIMVGDAKGNFNPKAYVTREELAVVADRIINYIKGN